MALQDLTPQLRTRLNRMEFAVGFFVALAVVFLISGFSYYLYHTAKQKGWFLPKARYFIFVSTAANMNVGDPVKLMGFTIGEILQIEAQPADDPNFNVYVEFEIIAPYYGYIWTDSRAKVSGDFLGNRFIEVTKGLAGVPTYEFDNQTFELKRMYSSGEYQTVQLESKYWMQTDEAPALADELGNILAEVKVALPGFFALTNQLVSLVGQATELTMRVNQTMENLQPSITHLNQITQNLTNSQGSLGEWAIPTNLNAQLETTLGSASQTLTNTQQDVHVLIQEIIPTLDNLGNITSNLNRQVQANSNILAHISSSIVTSDQFIQGLKRHWLLRSAFKKEKEKK